MADEWIKWGGGKCPVPADSYPMLKRRNGIDAFGFPAECYDWSHSKNEPETDIIAYRPTIN